MSVRKHKTNGTWLYDIRHPVTRERLRPSGFKTRAEADQARSIQLDKWRAEKHGIEVAPRSVTAKLTVHEAVAEEIEVLRRAHEQSSENYWDWNKNQAASILRRFLAHVPESLPIRSLSESHVRSFIDGLKKDGRKNGTIYTYMTRVRAGFRNIKERHKPVLTHWKFPNVPVGRKDGKGKLRRVWTPEEFQAVISVLENPPAEIRLDTRLVWLETRDFLLIKSMTGMRKTEIMLLEWSQVFFEWKILRARTLKQKDETYRDIPMSDDLADVLTKRKERLGKLDVTGPRVFPPRRGRGNTVWLYDSLIRACQIAGVQYGQKTFGVVPHGLRHTVATVMLNEGADLMTVAELLGDTPKTVLDSYAHTSMRSKRNAVASLPTLRQSVTKS